LSLHDAQKLTLVSYIDEARVLAHDLVDNHRLITDGEDLRSRELALVVTKLDEAAMWANEIPVREGE